MLNSVNRKKISLLALTSLVLSLGSLNSSEKSKLQTEYPFVRKQASPSEVDQAVEKINSKLRSLGSDDFVSDTKVVHDFAGNEYVIGRLADKGYGIYNVNNSDVVELSPFGSLPFDWNWSDVFYVPWVGFFVKEDGEYIDVRTAETIDDDYISQLEKQSEQFALQSIKDAEDEALTLNDSVSMKNSQHSTDHKIENGLITADREVPYSWYFKENGYCFPLNTGKVCGYVAASLLLAYAEIFQCMGYFSEKESNQYLKPYTGTYSYVDGKMQWDGVPDLKNSFLEGAWKKLIEDALPSTIDKAIHSFVRDEKKDVAYHNYFYYWEFASITKPIDDGFPAVYFGMVPNIDTEGTCSHTVVVYGYFANGDLLCHYGWPLNSQVIMSKLGFFSQGAVLSIYNESEHKHNQYFIDKYSGRKYCGCGELMSC